MAGLLIVEDRQSNREVYANLFKNKGFDVYEASSLNSGIETFSRIAARISGVITDIRLDESQNGDRSGVELAYKIKKLNQQIPVIGISAYEMSEFQENKVFDQCFSKSGTDIETDFIDNIGHIANTFQKYESLRYENASNQLLQVKDKYSISDSDFKYIISNIPISSTLSNSLLKLHDFISPESENDLTNVKFVILDNESPAGKKHGLTNTLPAVVYCESEDVYIAEVFSLPTIFTYGNSHEEALELLVGALKDYFLELEDTTNENHDIIKFGAFLRGLFDG